MLQVSGLSKRFRGVHAVRDVGFSVARGEIAALIGPNGAGKTTTFNLITGNLRADAGRVVLDGRDITGLKPHQACRAGLGRTFQIARPLRGLSVEDNVLVGALQTTPHVADARRRAIQVLERLHFADRRHLPAAALTLPDRKRLEVAKAVATGPKVLLLDEVMAGLRPTEVDLMVQSFRDLNRETGLTILLIEHVMRAVMALSAHVTVINFGQVVATGTPAQVVRDPAVLACYLGEDGVAEADLAPPAPVGPAPVGPAPDAARAAAAAAAGAAAAMGSAGA